MTAVTLDLFGPTAPRRIVMPDAEVWYFERLEIGHPCHEVLQLLIDTIPWEQRTIRIWGREHLQPRLTAWYGDPGCDYNYSRIRLQARPWTDLLRSLKQSVEKEVDSRFNSVLLNYYRDHNDSMGFHSDDEPELGPTPTIASLSVGAERTLVMKHKTGSVPPIRLTLRSGSLLLMKGDTQRNWMHGINKQTVPCGPRVNFTFRQISA